MMLCANKKCSSHCEVAFDKNPHVGGWRFKNGNGMQLTSGQLEFFNPEEQINFCGRCIEMADEIDALKSAVRLEKEKLKRMKLYALLCLVWDKFKSALTNVCN